MGESIEIDQKEDSMKRIRLKYSIAEFGGTLYEVGLKVSHQQEEPVVKRPQKPGRRSSSATEAQIAQRQSFKLAVAYAKTALADPQLRFHYADLARRQGKRPWGAAVADYMQGNDLLPKI